MDKQKLKKILGRIRFAFLFILGTFTIGALNNRFSPGKASFLAILGVLIWFFMSLLLGLFESEDYFDWNEEEGIKLKEINWKKYK